MDLGFPHSLMKSENQVSFTHTQPLSQHGTAVLTTVTLTLGADLTGVRWDFQAGSGSSAGPPVTEG